jgi:hypothetical protein
MWGHKGRMGRREMGRRGGDGEGMRYLPAGSRSNAIDDQTILRAASAYAYEVGKKGLVISNLCIVKLFKANGNLLVAATTTATSLLTAAITTSDFNDKSFVIMSELVTLLHTRA